MKKPKRTATLHSFIIKKLKNISTVSSNPNPSVDAHRETKDVNFNQHIISSHANEMTTPLLSPKNNPSFIENNCDGLINLIPSNESRSIVIFC